MARDPFYKTAAWRELRAQCIRRDVLCSTPGCGRFSVIADHIVPRAQGGADTLANLRGCCASCHSRVTAKADGGFGNRVKRDRTLRLKGCDVNGRPLDPTHWWNRDA